MTQETTVLSTDFLEERHWRSLLRDIHAGQVLPVVGPDLVTIPGADCEQIPYYSHLAEELGHRLGLKTVPSDTTPPTLNGIACDWLLSGNSSKEIYDEIRELVDDLAAPPSQALMDLATITDFGLYLSSTFDPLLGKALQQVRPGFLPERGSASFHPNNPLDLPQPLVKPFLYHILGTHDTYPDFVVWEEDYIEFICGLLRHEDNLPALFNQLRNRDLLLIGAPFNDWIVRFFLRVAKGKRFSEPRDQGRMDYVAEEPTRISHPTIFFYEQEVGSTRIIPGDPRLFVGELTRRWQQRFGASASDDIFHRMSYNLPHGAVFISYSTDDILAATKLAHGLLTAQIPVWMDKGRLNTGENYDRSLEHAVKNEASFFISVISNATEAKPDRYVHRERKWAAQRHVDGFVFYIPIDIDNLQQVNQEPEVFGNIHRETLPLGRVTPAFVQRMQRLVEEYRISGRPRG